MSSEKLRQILSEHEQTMSTYSFSRQSAVSGNLSSNTTLQADHHRMPRPLIKAQLEEERISSNINFGATEVDRNQSEVENSILVSKLPTIQRPNYLEGPPQSNKRVTISTSSRPLWPLGASMARMTATDFEKQIRRMKQSQLVPICLDLFNQVRSLERQLEEKNKSFQSRDLERINEEDEEEQFGSLSDTDSASGQRTRCRFATVGCPYKLPSMEQHEERECRYRPTRCPSLTCPMKPPFAKLLKHVDEEHDGTQKGRDRVCRNNSNHLVSSYVNVDKEPILYKTTRMTWVANELVLEGKYHFFLECMRVPPDWHLWLYFLGDEKDAEKFQVTITLFREDEYGRMGDASSFSAQRSYTGQVISVNKSKEEIAEYGLGFMVHDKQVRSLCGPIANNEEQLFGYEVTVYRK